jgi:hypothetical protein
MSRAYSIASAAAGESIFGFARLFFSGIAHCRAPSPRLAEAPGGGIIGFRGDSEFYQLVGVAGGSERMKFPSARPRFTRSDEGRRLAMGGMGRVQGGQVVNREVEGAKPNTRPEDHRPPSGFHRVGKADHHSGHFCLSIGSMIPTAWGGPCSGPSNSVRVSGSKMFILIPRVRPIILMASEFGSRPCSAHWTATLRCRIQPSGRCSMVNATQYPTGTRQQNPSLFSNVRIGSRDSDFFWSDSRVNGCVSACWRIARSVASCSGPIINGLNATLLNGW